jgi:hypothetical protein
MRNYCFWGFLLSLPGINFALNCSDHAEVVPRKILSGILLKENYKTDYNTDMNNRRSTVV